jgi:hypothetical protein
VLDVWYNTLREFVERLLKGKRIMNYHKSYSNNTSVDFKIRIIYNSLLRKIDDKDIIVAGGYCRDTILGVHHKDVDIFLNDIDPYELASIVEAMITKYSMVAERMPIDDASFQLTDDNPHSRRTINCVYRIKIYDTTYDLVSVKLDGEWTPDNLVSTFDYNMTKAWYDKDGERMCWTEDFQKGMESLAVVLTPLRPDNAFKAEIRALDWLYRTGLDLKGWRVQLTDIGPPFLPWESPTFDKYIDRNINDSKY